MSKNFEQGNSQGSSQGSEQESCPTSLKGGESRFETPDIKWDYLDSEESMIKYTRDAGGFKFVQFFVPSMGCASCVSLLERLPSKNEAVKRAEVNFEKKLLTVIFDHNELPLSGLAAWLEDLGYKPEFQELKTAKKKSESRRLLARLAVAGFAFGNIMLLAFSEYLGAEEFAQSGFQEGFGYLSLFLSLPVVFYSSSVYFSSAYKALKAKSLNIDVPVVIGIITLFVRSTYDVIEYGGMGYFDSLAGLLFFLLIGKWYQARTFDDLNYERDYKSWFPINVIRKVGDDLVPTPISDLNTDDVIRIHHGEIIPADSILISGDGLIDTSFTTGESHPITLEIGAEIDAGGRQLGGAILLKVVRPVEQSHLTKLWNSKTFTKVDDRSIKNPIDKISKHFTIVVLLIAFSTLAFWLLNNPATAWQAFTATLIVACPCALALSLPFTYGSALRVLGREGAYLKNSMVIERMAGIKHLVFDKTGTLTPSEDFELEFQGLSSPDESLKLAVSTLANQSAHPMSRAIAKFWKGSADAVNSFEEKVGEGVIGTIGDYTIRIGSSDWIKSSNTYADPGISNSEFQYSFVYVEVNGLELGRFCIRKPIRTGVGDELKKLSKHYKLSLISGDNSVERAVFGKWFDQDSMKFDQTPSQKKEFINTLKSEGQKVAMIGDGLNDAAALNAADLGVAVVDDLYAFSPSSDLILDARSLDRWADMMNFARHAQYTVYLLFAISFLYNIVGLAFAVQGLLTPVIAAILMPVSSMTIVLVAILRTRYTWWRLRKI